MAAHVALNSLAHRNLKVDVHPSADYGDNIGMVGVIPREYGRLVAYYPLFFRKVGEEGRFEPGAMLGFGNDENLFLANGRWDALYVPLQFQRQPFAVWSEGEGDAAKLTVAIDTESPRLKPAGEAIFLDDGRATDYLQNVTSALSELAQGAPVAFAYAAKLNELGLIEPVTLDIEFVDRSKLKLTGLYSISREKLAALKAKQLTELRDAGYLELLYYQLASMVHVSSLIARKNKIIAGL